MVGRIASDLSFVQGKLYRVKEDGSEEEIESHPFLTFWRRINPMYEFSSAALWKLFETYLMLKGEAYFIIERDLLGRPSELWPVPTHWVQMTPYLGYPYYQVRTSSGSIMNVSVDDMFVMRDLNPYDPFGRGLGQSEPLADEIEIDEYAAKFQKNFFLNDATPATIISGEDLTEEQRNRLEATWNESYKGVRNSHRATFLKTNVTVQKLAENMKDMDMIQGRIFIRDAVLEHFGVPREIMGITESSNRATSEAAQYIYAQNVLMPKLRMREEAINTQLLPMFGENLVWRYDDIVPKNQEFDKAKAIDGWNFGLLTKNESRQLLDLDDVENGDVYKSSFSDVFLGADDDPTVFSQMDSGAVPEEDQVELTLPMDEPVKAAPISHQAKMLMKSFDRELLKNERQFLRAANRFFSQQNEEILAALEGDSKAKDDIREQLEQMIENGCTQEEINSFIDGLYDWDKGVAELSQLFAPLWQSTYLSGCQMANDAYHMSVNAERLYRFARTGGAQRVKRITETTKEGIRKIVASGIDTGETYQQIADGIKNLMQSTPARARTIAQTEAHTSMMQGHMDGMQAGGIKTKKWLTSRDGAVRDSHKKLHGEVQDINKPFSNGLMFPGDPNVNKPEEVINCRCRMIAGDF